MISYPASTGRNFTEILRVIDSLQLGDKYRITTPVDWKQGDDVIVHPSVKSGEEAEKLFPGYKTVKVGSCHADGADRELTRHACSPTSASRRTRRRLR